MSLLEEDSRSPRYQFPWAIHPPHWKRVAQTLGSKTVESTGELAKLVGVVGKASTEVADYQGLFAAISELASEMEGFDFFGRLLPQLQRDVLSAPDVLGDDCAVLFHECGEGQVQLTHHQAYLIACLAFFGLCRPLYAQYTDHLTRAKVKDRFGHLDWSQVYGRGGSVAVARIKCQLSYLHVVASCKAPENDTYLTFHRTVLDAKAEPLWPTSKVPISDLQVPISSDDKIEDVQADAHIDFANKKLHIGEIIPSATQEEVLFSIRPECFVGLLLCEVMQARDAIVITGARRFCNYTGYLRTFQYAGLCEETEPPAIIAIDSLVNSIEDNQFHPDRIARDINKAYLGFTSLPASLKFQSISTGQWGCGAFRGDPIFKFIQQVLAASQAGALRLHFSVFHQPVLAEELRAILQGLQEIEMLL